MLIAVYSFPDGARFWSNQSSNAARWKRTRRLSRTTPPTCRRSTMAYTPRRLVRRMAAASSTVRRTGTSVLGVASCSLSCLNARDADGARGVLPALVHGSTPVSQLSPGAGSSPTGRRRLAPAKLCDPVQDAAREARLCFAAAHSPSPITDSPVLSTIRCSGAFNGGCAPRGRATESVAKASCGLEQRDQRAS